MLNVKNISKKFKNDKYGYKNISFKIDEKSFVALVGPNGAGKTSLIKSIVGLYSHHLIEGDIVLNDEISFRNNDFRKEIAYIPEYVSLPSGYNVKEYLVDVLLINLTDKSKIIEKISMYAKKFNCLYLLSRNTNNLSSGEEKKIMILQAFCRNSNFIIMDEPTANLDIESRKSFFKICQEYVNQNKSIMISTHVLSEVEFVVDKIIGLKNGGIQKIISKDLKIFDVEIVFFNTNNLKEFDFEKKFEKWKWKLHNESIFISKITDVDVIEIQKILISNKKPIAKFRKILNSNL